MKTEKPAKPSKIALAKQPTKTPQDPDFSSSKPTFVALFEDGIVTRMTTHCAHGRLELARGIALSHAAYGSRASRQPPAIVAAKFVEPGYTDLVLKEYSREELESDL